MHAEGERYVETVSGWGEGVKLVPVVTMVGAGVSVVGGGAAGGRQHCRSLAVVVVVVVVLVVVVVVLELEAAKLSQTGPWKKGLPLMRLGIYE